MLRELEQTGRRFVEQNAVELMLPLLLPPRKVILLTVQTEDHVVYRLLLFCSSSTDRSLPAMFTRPLLLASHLHC